MRAGLIAVVAVVLVGPIWARAGVLSDVRGVVVDAKGDAVKDAAVTLRLKDSEFSLTQKTDGSGEFLFAGVASGEYIVAVEAEGFATAQQSVTVVTGGAPQLRFQLQVGLKESVEVKAQPGVLGSETATQTTLVTKEQVRTTPGATRTNSTSAITSYVPGSYMVHNQLHVHGGHQVTWLIDGVPIPSSNGGVDVGTPFNLNDVSALEAQRGSYSAEFGDRTYGIFGIVPRNGFDATREAEISIIYGNFNLSDNFISFGDHNKTLAYYVSAHGMRTDYGLAAPTPRILHDQNYAYGGFGNLIYKPDDNNQLRLMASFENEYYDVPNSPDDQASGMRDEATQRDRFVFLTWVRTYGQHFLLSVSPFYHSSAGSFVGGPGDTPLIPRHERSYEYEGLHLVASAVTRKHSLKAGLYAFAEQDRNLFDIRSAGPATPSLNQLLETRGNLESFFVGDQYKVGDRLSLIGGVRLTRFAAALHETAVNPRIGATLRLPRLNWTLHGFYGRYYQEPPLSTVTGPLLQLAVNNGLSFVPLKGERNEEYQFGMTVPFEGCWVDVVAYQTNSRNFLDHQALGASNIQLPVTIDRARIRGLDVSFTSASIFKRLRISFIYALMRVEGKGAITGGLTDFTAPPGFFFLDHDQRHTLTAGLGLKLPQKLILFEETHYGSGFASVGDSGGGDNGGPKHSHLPGRFRFDVSLMRSFGKGWTVGLNSWNVLNSSYLLDNSPALGGVHWATPRQLWLEVRYRFRY
jgi:hypothetical protein